MKIKLLLSITILGLGLVNCGGGGSDGGSTTTPTRTTSVSVSVKDVQNQYISGVKVYYGNDGQHSATTGSIISGGGGIPFATFLGASVGSYDGHLTLSGYNFSMYGITTDKDITVKVPFYQDTPKQIDVGITVTGSASATHTAYFRVGNKVYSSAITAGAASFTLNQYGSLQAVTGELIVTQGAGISNAGNLLLLGGTASVSLGQQSFAGFVLPLPPQQNFTADFSAVPATPFLANVNIVSTPTGVNLSSLYLGGAAIIAGFSFPDDIYSSAVGADYWLAKAQNAGLTNFWFAQGGFSVGQTLDVSSSFTSMVTATAQSGNTISWVNAQSTTPITLSIVEIVNASAAVKWKAIFDGTVTSWTLPTAPTLFNGSYTLNITNIIAPSLTKEQYAEGLFSNSTPREVMQLKAVPYTR